MTITVEAEALVQSLLKISSVRIKDIEETSLKINKILKDGSKNLHFISDFDMTMTLHWSRNEETDALERSTSSHRVPTTSGLVSQTFLDGLQGLYNKYYPIEIDPNLTYDEKLPLMKEWWTELHKVFVKENMSMQDLSKMCSRSKLEFRNFLKEILSHCNTTQIPFLVFSAGIENVIEEILRQHNMLYDNMHIVSNRMVFNDQGVCVDFQEPLIHVLNKSEFQLEKTPYYPLIEQRSNVILMGDSLGDLQMSKGVAHDLCLNIGFLNHDIKVLEPVYLEKFDILIEGDANMKPVLEILTQLK